MELVGLSESDLGWDIENVCIEAIVAACIHGRRRIGSDLEGYFGDAAGRILRSILGGPFSRLLAFTRIVCQQTACCECQHILC